MPLAVLSPGHLGIGTPVRFDRIVLDLVAEAYVMHLFEGFNTPGYISGLPAAQVAH
jgi:hypothetical protein